MTVKMGRTVDRFPLGLKPYTFDRVYVERRSSKALGGIETAKSRFVILIACVA